MNRPNFDILTQAEIKSLRKFVNLDLRKAMARQMPDEYQKYLREIEK